MLAKSLLSTFPPPGGIAKNEISFLLIGFGAYTAGLVATVGPRARRDGGRAGWRLTTARRLAPRRLSASPLCSAHALTSPRLQVRGDLEDYTLWASGIKSAIKFMSSARKCPTRCAECSHRATLARPAYRPTTPTARPTRSPSLVCVRSLACALSASPILKLQKATRKAKKKKREAEKAKKAKKAQRQRQA